MNLFGPSKHNEELIKLLRKSRSNFRFDPDLVKYRLLASVREAGQKTPSHFRFSRVIRYSSSFAGLVLVISTTFAFASNSRPGDTLFGLNKFGENVVLQLPLSVQQKALVREHIVTNRLEALDQVQTDHEVENLESEDRSLEAIKESNESLSRAVDVITENKQKLEAAGKTEAVEKLEHVLDQLQDQAQKREVKIKQIADQTKDAKKKEEIQNHLKKIEESRKKARLHIKKYQSTEKDSNINDLKKPD